MEANYSIFEKDINSNLKEITRVIKNSRFLIIGGAGTIGQAVTKEIFKYSPKLVHVIDISENNLVELVRDLRSSFINIDIDFKTFVIDYGSKYFDLFFESNKYDYVLNLSAMKHVRAERDVYSLLRMIDINILYPLKVLSMLKDEKFFCVSSDKASNPANMMGATKKIMELALFQKNKNIISSSRFANVLFSDGSLPFGFMNRFLKKQPLSAPFDIRRFFISSKEAGELCLLSTIFGNANEIYFPKISIHNLKSFKDLAIEFLLLKGYEPYECENEEEAIIHSSELIKQGKWPCYFFKSDTTGEKSIEEFYQDDDQILFNKYKNIGIIKNSISNQFDIEYFINKLNYLKDSKNLIKSDLIDLFKEIIPGFNHHEKNKFLDERM